jgi:hypothetical protein
MILNSGRPVTDKDGNFIFVPVEERFRVASGSRWYRKQWKKRG